VLTQEPTAIITGACGFVGAVMAARLKESSWRVIGIDSYARGLNAPRLAEFGIKVLELDCMNGIKGILDEVKPQVVFHFAAATGDLTRPVSELIATNVDMTKQIFEECISMAEPPLFVFPTTSLALGVPDSSYVETKEMAIRWLRAHKAKDQALLFRFFNNCGGYKGLGELRKNEVHALPALYKAWKTRQPFYINGNDYETKDGTPSRDYIHVVDTVDWIRYCVRKKQQKELTVATVDGLIEVGCGYPRTTLDVVNAFSKAVVSLKLHDVAEDPIIVRTEMRARRNFDCGMLACSSAGQIWAHRAPFNLTNMMHDAIQVFETMPPTVQ